MLAHRSATISANGVKRRIDYISRRDSPRKCAEGGARPLVFDAATTATAARLPCAYGVDGGWITVRSCELHVESPGSLRVLNGGLGPRCCYAERGVGSRSP